MLFSYFFTTSLGDESVRTIEVTTGTAKEYHGADGRFRPGNPGKPKGAGYKPIELALKDKLAEVDPETGLTGAETIAVKVMAMAKDGVEWAIRWITERTEGRAREAEQRDAVLAVPIRLLDFGEVAE